MDIVWTAGDDPVVLTGVEEKGYGGFCLRFAPREATAITTDAGRLVQDTLEVPYAWADLSARFAGRAELSGAAVFIDAANPGFPNGWITRHYGFLGVNWPGLRSVTLNPTGPCTCSTVSGSTVAMPVPALWPQPIRRSAHRHG